MQPSMSLPTQQTRLIAISLRYASRLGLGQEDAEDCAMDFVARILKMPQPTPNSSAWLHRCAHNHACNYLRTLSRRRQREQPANGKANETSALETAYVSFAPGPRTLTMRKELWMQVARAISQLTPAQRELFVRYHLRNQSVEQLAARFHRTPHAIEESLSQARKRLAVLLAREGWTAADARILFRSSALNLARSKSHAPQH